MDVEVRAPAVVAMQIVSVGSVRSGRVVGSELRLGREVVEGEVLVELDVEVPWLQREAAEAEKEAALARLGEAQERLRAAGGGGTRGAGARANGTTTGDDDGGTVASGAGARANGTITCEDGGTSSTLDAEVAVLEAEASAASARVAAVEEEIEAARIRAPATGVLGSVRALAAGEVVLAGEILGKVVTEGPPRLVAWIPVEEAVINNQDGWFTVGGQSFPVVVTAVGAVAREGRVEVELSGEVPRVDGLSGEVEIVVGRGTLAGRVLGW